jgi:tetratricopeptide (TPR) repeat protein
VAEIYRKTGHADWAVIEEEKERKIPPLDCGGVERSVAELGEPQGETSIPPARREQRYSGQKLQCDFLGGRYRDVIALATNVKTPESLYWQARAYNALAFQTSSRLVNLKPSAQLHQVMAKLYLDRRLYSQSAKEWREALKFSPGDPRIQKGLAVALSLSGDLDDAKTIMEDLLRREPYSAELNYLLGDTLMNSQQIELAIAYLKKAVELDPKLLQAQKSLARAYLRIEKGEQAIPHLKAALPVDEDGSLHYQLAQAYRITGQQELARETLKKFQEIRSSAGLGQKTSAQRVEITPP